MLNYRVTGDGFPVVLLHGYMESLRMWDGLFDELSQFSWWSVDLPGHGDTLLVGEEMEPSVDWFASQVFDFLNEIPRLKPTAILLIIIAPATNRTFCHEL